jgi:hypothetical protein
MAVPVPMPAAVSRLVFVPDDRVVVVAGGLVRRVAVRTPSGTRP